jgi:hypothetical protein
MNEVLPGGRVLGLFLVNEIPRYLAYRGTWLIRTPPSPTEGLCLGPCGGHHFRPMHGAGLKNTHRGNSRIRNHRILGSCSTPMPKDLR